ncbi:MAG: GTPase [Ignisphaera sp.]|nr:50S ribosome-binding GTPase [Ignisphaera sp.]MDW8086111.1 GTPase [Ignisphaera sp.]
MMLLSWSNLKRLIGRADVVLEVIEARNPPVTRSAKVEKLVEELGKILIIIINKCDLIPLHVCKEWQRHFEAQNIKAFYVSSLTLTGIRKLKQYLDETVVLRPATILLVGYPKVGKSSLINALKGSKSASTSPYPGSPGYTKSSTLYKILPGIYMIDTPGIIPPEGSDIEMIIRRAPVEKIQNPVRIAQRIIEIVQKFDSNIINHVYHIRSTEPLEVLEELAIKRGWVSKRSKEANIDEAARAIIRDYLRGKLTYYILPSSDR